jgi:hypothetical protein
VKLEDSYIMLYTEIENNDFGNEEEKEKTFVENMDWQEVVRTKNKKEDERSRELKRKRTEEEMKKQTAKQNMANYDKKKQMAEIFMREMHSTGSEETESVNDENNSHDVYVKKKQEERKDHREKIIKKSKQEKEATEEREASKDLEEEVPDKPPAQQVKFT